MTPFEEFELAINVNIKSGEIGMCEDSFCNDMIGESFPFYGSKIDWEKVPNYIEMELSEDLILSGKDFFARVTSLENLSDMSTCMVMGDNQMGDKMVYGSLYSIGKILEHILLLPQHTYIIESRGMWCMVFTMEGYATFGYANKTL